MIINTINGMIYVNDVEIQAIQVVHEEPGVRVEIHTAEKYLVGKISFEEYAHIVQKVDQLQAERSNIMKRHRDMILGDDDDESN